jgi:CRISPR-associated exonuclease Cas4
MSIFWLLLLLLFVVLAVAVFAQSAARSATRGAGLPRGNLLYSDTGFPVGRTGEIVTERGERLEKALVSRRYHLTGRPDYLVKTTEGVVPIEAKSTKCPAGGRAYDSHVMQLAAYCLLVEDVLDERVPYGVIRYRDCELTIDYTPELREDLLALLEEIMEARRAEEVHRSHEDPRRCAGCSMREVCDEALIDF